MNQRKRISILGSTGSIGVQTLDVIRAFPDQFEVISLAAGKNTDLLKQQILEFHPKLVSVASDQSAEEIVLFVQRNQLNCGVVSQTAGLIQVATFDKPDLLIVAIVGTASLMPTYHAIQEKIPIGLACKEVLVAAGKLIMDLARVNHVPILPVDSEHAAIKQCLAGIAENTSEIDKLILTASGGPFWNWSIEEFASIERADALKHPNWDMGQKITIDSATLMNKGLEVIEAHHLFAVPFSHIEVTIHPQSLVHSMVEFTDGTILAQMGMPDMRHPIQYVLTYPEKWKNDWPKMRFTKLWDLAFYPPDFEKFPLLKLAFEAGEKGGNAPVVMNAANEAVVALFLQNRIRFSEIPAYIFKAMDAFAFEDIQSIDAIVSLDQAVKAFVPKMS